MSMSIFEQLAAPFPPELVSWRPGSMTKDKTKARALAYIDARDVMRRLDDVCGPGNWQCDYLPMPNGTTCCRIEVRIDGEWIGKANGAGATDIEGEKGGYSDAFKRAAVLWGIGRYLYDLDAPWVKIDEWKQIDKSELPKLVALLSGVKQTSAYAARKDGAYERLVTAMRACVTLQDLQGVWRDNWVAIQKLPDHWQDHLIDEKERLKGELQARAVA